MFFVGQGSEDSWQLAARPGVLRQSQMVQHPCSRLEPADSSPRHRPACPPTRPPTLLPGLLRLLRRRRVSKLHESVQLVDESKKIEEKIKNVSN